MPDVSHLEHLFLWVADEKTWAGSLDFAWWDQTHVLSSPVSCLSLGPDVKSRGKSGGGKGALLCFRLTAGSCQKASIQPPFSESLFLPAPPTKMTVGVSTTIPKLLHFTFKWMQLPQRFLTPKMDIFWRAAYIYYLGKQMILPTYSSFIFPFKTLL